MELSLSIIICTKDREQSLWNCLYSVFEQTRLPNEIILVDDGNLDKSDFETKICEQAIKFKYIHKKIPGLTASRNLGINHSSGDIILFIDDDVILDPLYIESIMELYEDDSQNKIGGITGAINFKYKPGVLTFLRLFGMDGQKPGSLLPSGYGVLVRQGEIDKVINVDWLAGCNMSYRKQVFINDKFDESLGAYAWGEDRDFSHKISKKFHLIATPNALVTHLKEPEGRIHPERYGYMEVYYLYRFFYQHMPHKKINWLALTWSFMGIFLKNTLRLVISKERLSVIKQLQGNYRGLYTIIFENGQQM
jgi:glycosyltransferase involved in cell wall biosynthesis